MSALRKDNAHAADSIRAKYTSFGVMVFDPGDPDLVSALTDAIQKQAPGMPVVVQPIGQPIPDDARRVQAMVLPAALALDPPEALRVILEDFKGAKVVVAGRSSGLGLERTAQTRTQRHCRSGGAGAAPVGGGTGSAPLGGDLARDDRARTSSRCCLGLKWRSCCSGC